MTRIDVEWISGSLHILLLQTADEMLAVYSGREEELLKNLRKMKAKQDKEAEAGKVKAEVEALVEELNAPKTADEMLAAYAGREDELLKNLRKMKAKQSSSSTSSENVKDTAASSDKAAVRAEVEALVNATNPGKSADELLKAYEGKEDELVKNLKKMKAKQERASAKPSVDKTAVKAEVTSLVEETNPGKSAEELLEAYEGREEELVAHLKKLKASKST